VNRDRGSATVWVATAAMTLCAVFAVVLAMGQAVVVRHRAGAAADLAALAAADHALHGGVTACGKAEAVARAQDTEVVRCAVKGEIADVTAQARFGPYAPTARSRAGPPGLAGQGGGAGAAGTESGRPPGNVAVRESGPAGGSPVRPGPTGELSSPGLPGPLAPGTFPPGLHGAAP
jgi:secretion/DNA translocation related TadE-like protein